MGIKMHDIQTRFNDIVDMYKSMGYTEVPCSSIYTVGSVMRSIDLTKDGKTSRIWLRSNSVKPKGFKYAVIGYSLEVSVYFNYRCVATEVLYNFYHIDGNYYTVNLDDVKAARELHTKRYLDYHCTKHSKSTHIDINKLSHKTLNYIRNIINTALKDRPLQYAIYDLYTTTVSKVRKFVIVFKNCDCSGTESIFFDPRTKLINFN